MREPWVRALLVGALALAGYGCTPDDQPACTTDGDCGDGRVCAAGACVAQPCEDGDLRACGVGGVACPGTQTCTDGVWGACEAPPEVCDGIDNDCDRRADEGFAGLGDACAFGEGECHDRGHIVCTADGQGVMCDARPGEPVEEVCNGRDDDCDGDVDEALGGGACDTGSFGACAAGAEACVDGDTRCVPDVEPSDELCDGVDNDCDGNLDEAANGGPLAEPCYDGPAGTADVGACAAGVRVCTDGMFGGCAEQVLPAEEICDGVDNDCNGEADDGDVECVCVPGSQQPCYSGPAGTAGVGVCAAGSQTCADDGSAWGPCAGEVVPGLELCDGEDDDCNGVIDDAVGVNELCEVGLGACAAAGVRRCDLGSGQVVCDAEEGLPADETCNGIDDDCNGQVDDVQQVGGACEVGIGGCAVGGSLVCGPDGGVFCAAEAGQPVDEICNGVDDDCDGRIDDVPGLGEPCEVGAGRCRSTGVLVCGAEGLTCGARPGAPRAEICGNRIDDDCDGEVDDDDVCGDCGNGRRDEGEGCDDGNREDGDGCDADCAVEDGFECFDGPADTAVAIDGLECEDYAPVHVPDWVGGYGVAYVGGVVQFAGDQQRFTSGYAVRTTDAEGDTSELLVGYDPERGFREAERPGLAPLFLIRRFDRLDAGDYAVRFPDVDCGDNQGTIDVEFRTLDACRPLACAADADCLFADEVCLDGACVPADCGNGRRDTGEQCDDGNRAAGDGCDGHCQVEEGFECFAGPDESVVTLDGLGDCNVWRDVELAPWEGGYGAAYAGGAVRFGLPSRYNGRFAVRTTAGRVARVFDVGLDADGALIEADGPEAAEALFAGTFVPLPDGAQAVLYPDTECEDNEGTVDVAFRSLDLCRPAVCAVDADCVFADEVCVEGACGAIICGNGRRDAGESCDDGNADDGDGCSAECQVEDGFECFDGPGDTAVTVDGADCEDYAPVDVPEWAGGYGVAYIGGVVQFAGNGQRYTGSYAVRTTDVVAEEWYLWVGFDPDEGFEESHDPGRASRLLANRFDRLPDGDYAVRFPDANCADNRGTIDLELRTLDLCQPIGCEVDADCPGIGEFCIDGVCGLRGPFCGDGDVDPGEECDDGDSEAGDGCSAICVVEPGGSCVDFTFSFGVTDSVPFDDAPAPRWTVSDDGRSITQAVNSAPAHYASDLPISAEYVTRLEIRVEDPEADDDVLGWTIGGGATALSDPAAPYLLFSWKQEEQDHPVAGFAPRGLRVARVDGPVSIQDLWQVDGEHITELALGATQGDLGWIDDQTYTIDIIGDGDRMRVYVDGVLEFDLADVPLGDGHLGTYTTSQPGFSARLISPESIQICSGLEPVCGDGTIDPGEGCDDGNADDGDGCSSACAIEPDHRCDPFTFALGEDDSIPTNQHEAPVWQASPDGRTLTQLTNSWPAHRTTNLPISGDYVARFDMTVTSPDDDDIIGWSIGGGPSALSDPAQPYLLFSWLQDNVRHPDTRELITGLRVYLVEGPTTPQRLLYGGPNVTLLARAATLGDARWRNLQTYRIDVFGDSDRLEVFVDGVREFDLVDVPIGNGNLGYYVRSQLGYRVDLIAPEDIQVCLPAEDCANGEDDNGDGAVDCDDPGCAAEPVCLAPPEICDSGVDEDGDGAVDCDDPDCVDAEVCEAIDPCAVVDRFEPNDRLDLAALIEPGSYADLAWCPDGDEGDWYAVDVCAGGRLSVTARHTYADGNLQLSLSRLAAGQLEVLYQAVTATDDDTVDYVNTGADFRALLRVNGPANVYDLDVAVEGCGEAREICDNGADDDGDGLVDCADPDCARVLTCFCAAPDPYEDDTTAPTLLVPGDRVTNMPLCPPDAGDQWSLYGCAEAPLVGVLEFTAWRFGGDTSIRFGNYIDGVASVALGGYDGLISDVRLDAPEGCEPGEVPAALAPEGESLRIAGVIDADDPLVEARCPDPAEVRYQTLRVTNDGPDARVVDFTAHFRDAPGSLAIFDEPFDGPILLDECHPDPAFGYRGILMPPGTTHSVVVFNTAPGVESNQFVLRVAEPGPPVELCHNGADDDGDGAIDCADDDCADEERCAVAGVEICNSGFDDNGDGNVDCGDRQCLDDPLCVEPAVCPGGDRYGPHVVREPIQLGAGRFEGLINCDAFRVFTTRLCAGGRLTITATGPQPVEVLVAPTYDGALPAQHAFGEGSPAVTRIEMLNDEPADHPLLIGVELELAEGEGPQPFALDIQIEGCSPLSRFEICNTGRDEDGNGAIDCDDPGCADAPPCLPSPRCTVRFHDGDGPIGCNDPACFQDPACTLEDQMYFSIASGDFGTSALSPTLLYRLDAIGAPRLIAIIDSPEGEPEGIGALAHDGQDLWGFVGIPSPDGEGTTRLGPIDLARGALEVAGEIPGRLVVGAAFNGLGELWMLDTVNQALVVAVDLEVDPARSIPLPAAFVEGDIAFIAADSTRFMLTTSDGGLPLGFRGDTATGLLEPLPRELPVDQRIDSGLAYGRSYQQCAPGLYSVDIERGNVHLLDLATHERIISTQGRPIPDYQGSPWVDGASGPRVLLTHAGPGCEGIVEFCSGPSEDGDGLDGCADPDCLAADPFCVE